MVKELLLVVVLVAVFYTAEVEAKYKYNVAFNPMKIGTYKCPKNFRRTDLDYINKAHWVLMTWGTKDNPKCALKGTKAKCFAKKGKKKSWMTFVRGHGEYHITKYEHISDMRSSEGDYPKKAYYKKKMNPLYKSSESNVYSKSKYPYEFRKGLSSGRPYSKVGFPYTSRVKPGFPHRKPSSLNQYKYSFPYYARKRYPSRNTVSSGHPYYPSKGYPYTYGHSNSYKKHPYNSGSHPYPSKGYPYKYGYSNSYKKHPYNNGYQYHPKGGSRKYRSSSLTHKYSSNVHSKHWSSSSDSSFESSSTNTAVPMKFSLRAMYFKIRGVQDLEIQLHGEISETIHITKGKKLDPRKKTWVCIQFETYPVFNEILFTFKFGLKRKAKFWDLYLFSCCENLKDKIDFA